MNLLLCALLAVATFAQTEGCQDYAYWTDAGWLDASGMGCDWYAADVNARCELANLGTDDMLPRQACCACNGGSTSQCSEGNTQTFVTFELCTEDTSASSGSEDAPIVQVCDSVGNCVGAGVTASLIPDGKFTVPVDTRGLSNTPESAKITASGEDGLCIKNMMVDFVGGDITYPAWIDTNCQSDKPCECEYYTTSDANIWITCQETDGQSNLHLSNDDETLIIVFSKHMNDVEISLTADIDMDLRLYKGPSSAADECGRNTPSNGVCPNIPATATSPEIACQVHPLKATICIGQIVVGYGGTYDQPGSIDYEGMTITFSGDRFQAPVTEDITIDRTTEVMSLYVYSLGDGTGLVNYKWSGIEPCTENFGCTPCVDWACKPPNVPVCDGQHGACTIQSDSEAALAAQSVENGKCDSKQTNCATFISSGVPDCIDWPTQPPTTSPTTAPTTHPSTIPTTSQPTKSPTTSPTSAPSTQPSTHPTTSPTTQPTTTTTTTTTTTMTVTEEAKPCTDDVCNGRGTTTDPDHRDGCQCICDPGWTGDNCDYQPCICGPFTVTKGRFDK